MAEQSDLVWGIHAVRAALQRGTSVLQLYYTAGKKAQRINEIKQIAEAKNLPIQQLSHHELESMAGDHKHQGVVAKVRLQQTQDEPFLKALLQRLDEEAFLLLLDGVQDPHNLGACLRTADAAGVHAVVAPRDKSASLNATVRKVASGAAESVPFIQVTNLARCMRWLREQGVWLIGTADDAAETIYQTDLTGPLAIVMGGEGRGLRHLTKENCDASARLPMLGEVESLNVSVAAGVTLYEALRQRDKNR